MIVHVRFIGPPMRPDFFACTARIGSVRVSRSLRRLPTSHCAYAASSICPNLVYCSSGGAGSVRLADDGLRKFDSQTATTWLDREFLFSTPNSPLRLCGYAMVRLRPAKFCSPEFRKTV